MLNEKSGEAVVAIQEQINKFDNKANSLITIVSIVFALSLGLLETFNQFIGIEFTAKMQLKFNWLIALSIVYFISFATEMNFLLLVIYPRRKKRGKKTICYYLDAAKLSKEEIVEQITSQDNSDIDIEAEQISVNAKICSSKHKFLVVSIWLMLPLFVFMFATFIVAIV